ncbi:MAG: hypothetical protein AAF196_08920 [Planctomycetota bacterium]
MTDSKDQKQADAKPAKADAAPVVGSAGEELRRFASDAVAQLDEEDREIAARAIAQGVEVAARAALGENVDRQAKALKAITKNLSHRAKRAVEQAALSWTSRIMGHAIQSVLV